MHEVVGERDPEVATDRAGSGLGGVRRTDEPAGDLDRGFALQDDGHDGSRGHERHEVVIEGLLPVLCVVLSDERERVSPELEPCDLEPLGLETGDDSADETPVDGIGLEQDERSLHGFFPRPVVGPGSGIGGLGLGMGPGERCAPSRIFGGIRKAGECTGRPATEKGRLGSGEPAGGGTRDRHAFPAALG